MALLTLATLWQVLAAIVPAWLLGAVTGYLLPRPATKPQSASSWALFLSGGRLRRWAVLYHLAIIVRELWRHLTAPGTFRAFCLAVASWVQGRGFDFQWAPAGATTATTVEGTACASTRDPDNWYVTQKDLAFFQFHMEEGGESPGASPWELLMEKEVPNVMKYTCWRRTLSNGKTEYKSMTHSADTSAQEMIDIYFDDDFRPKWDTMVIQHEILEQGDVAQRQQVVRWTRRFPFKFISDREYTIARRLFRTDDAMYGLTKVVDHPASRRDTLVVKMDVFYSMWRSRNVACPWGSGRPACETLLLHHEQFKIVEHLARFAVRHGMWGFVKNLSERMSDYTAARRLRVPPDEPDALAYGYAYGGAASSAAGGGGAASPDRMHASHSALSLCSMESSTLGGLGSSLSRQGSAGLGVPRGKSVPTKVKGILAVAMASSLAVLLKRSNSVPTNLSNVKALKSARGQARLRRPNSIATF